MENNMSDDVKSPIKVTIVMDGHNSAVLTVEHEFTHYELCQTERFQTFRDHIEKLQKILKLGPENVGK